MDDQTRITTYKAALRFKYGARGTRPADIVGLQRKIEELTAEAEGSVVITSSGFEGEQSAGQLVLEPLEKLNAALDLLNELDPDNAPDQPASVIYADFSAGESLQT